MISACFFNTAPGQMTVNDLGYLYNYVDCKQTAAGKNVTVSRGKTSQQLAQSDTKITVVLPFNVWDFFLSADITNNHFAARLIPC